MAMVPVATSQAPVPVPGEEGAAGVAGAGCVRQCAPEEVNEGGVKTGADSVQTILYGHFQDILNRAPLNTQVPGEQESELNNGFLMPTIQNNCAVPECDVNFANNMFQMFSSAGFVEIVDGQWRTHQEPGLAEPVEIKGDTFNLYFYLSPYPVPGQSSDNSPTGPTAVDVMPKVGIYARMETGRHPFSSKSTLIAEGDTGTGDTADAPTGEGRTTMIMTPAGESIYEFQVPMEVKTPVIPSVWEGAEGFLVTIIPYQVRGKDGSAIQGSQVMQADWRMRAGPSTPPRIVMEVGNPLVTKAASLTVFNQAMFARWSMSSPWGSYDTDDRSLDIKISGPTDVPSDLVKLVIIKRSVDHDGHFKPINITWRFDYQKAGLKDGEYSVDVSMMNLQRTYRLTEQLTFKMVDGKPTDLKIIGSLGDEELGQQQQAPAEESPAFELMGLFMALIVGTAFIRRRRE